MSETLETVLRASVRTLAAAAGLSPSRMHQLGKLTVLQTTHRTPLTSVNVFGGVGFAHAFGTEAQAGLAHHIDSVPTEHLPPRDPQLGRSFQAGGQPARAEVGSRSGCPWLTAGDRSFPPVLARTWHATWMQTSGACEDKSPSAASQWCRWACMRPVVRRPCCTELTLIKCQGSSVRPPSQALLGGSLSPQIRLPSLRGSTSSASPQSIVGKWSITKLDALRKFFSTGPWLPPAIRVPAKSYWCV